MTDNTNKDQAQAQQPRFDITRLYTKDISFETPNVPAVFTEKVAPALNYEFNCKDTKIGEDLYEVVLRITVTCKVGEKVAFLCEVNQAGLFLVQNVNDQTKEYLLNATAPNILFPYVRETISNLVNKASFPPLNLAPLNFEALYRVKKAQEAQKAQQAATPAEKA